MSGLRWDCLDTPKNSSHNCFSANLQRELVGRGVCPPVQTPPHLHILYQEVVDLQAKVMWGSMGRKFPVQQILHYTLHSFIITVMSQQMVTDCMVWFHGTIKLHIHLGFLSRHTYNYLQLCHRHTNIPVDKHKSGKQKWLTHSRNIVTMRTGKRLKFTFSLLSVFASLLYCKRQNLTSTCVTYIEYAQHEYLWQLYLHTVGVLHALRSVRSRALLVRNIAATQLAGSRWS